MWIQLLATKTIQVRGESKRYHPGDYVNVGKQTALLWLSQREAIMPGVNYMQETGVTDGAGAVIIGAESDTLHPGRAALMDKDTPIIETVVLPDYKLQFEKNLIWDGAVPMRKELIPIGLFLLDTWQIAIPLHSYSELASQVGDEAERAVTAQVIPDLRVPLYETGLMYVRRCNETERLFSIWRKELERGSGANGRLAFIRALYQSPLLILALPVSWHRMNE